MNNQALATEIKVIIFGAANDDGLSKTAPPCRHQQEQQQQGGMSPALRLIQIGQQQSGKACL